MNPRAHRAVATATMPSPTSIVASVINTIPMMFSPSPARAI